MNCVVQVVCICSEIWTVPFFPALSLHVPGSVCSGRAELLRVSAAFAAAGPGQRGEGPESSPQPAAQGDVYGQGGCAALLGSKTLLRFRNKDIKLICSFQHKVK